MPKLTSSDEPTGGRCPMARNQGGTRAYDVENFGAKRNRQQERAARKKAALRARIHILDLANRNRHVIDQT